MNLQEQTNTQEQEEIFTKENAVLEIGVLRSECAVMGANDSEIIELNQLMSDVKEGKIDPTEAVKTARSIRHGKMEYR